MTGDGSAWLPDPTLRPPIPEHARVGFLAPVPEGANVCVGTWTDADDPAGLDGVFERGGLARAGAA